MKPNAATFSLDTRMLAKCECRGVDDYVNALREILQEIVLLRLRRSKFFEKAARRHLTLTASTLRTFTGQKFQVCVLHRVDTA